MLFFLFLRPTGSLVLGLLDFLSGLGEQRLNYTTVRSAKLRAAVLNSLQQAGCFGQFSASVQLLRAGDISALSSDLRFHLLLGADFLFGIAQISTQVSILEESEIDLTIGDLLEYRTGFEVVALVPQLNPLFIKGHDFGRLIFGSLLFLCRLRLMHAKGRNDDKNQDSVESGSYGNASHYVLLRRL